MADDDLTERMRDYAPLRREYCVPLYDAGHVIGVLRFEASARESPSDDAALQRYAALLRAAMRDR